MASSISKYYLRGRYVLFHEGISSFLKQGFSFISLSLFQYGIYQVYETDITTCQPKIEIKLKSELTFKVIYTSADYNQLAAEGYNFKQKVSQPLLDKGAMLLCIFDKRDLVCLNWVATTERAKHEIDIVPFKVDFNNGEVCSGGSYTEPKYRNLGICSYILSIKAKILAQKGVKINKFSIQKGNIASIKASSKFNNRLISQWRYLKILWWKSWKETISDGEDNRGQKRNTPMDRFSSAGIKVYSETPPAIKFVFKPIIAFKNLRLRVDQWILTGEEISRKHRVEILYSGITQNKNYLADLVFGGSHEEKYQGKKWFWECFGDSNRQFSCNLYITDIPVIFKSLFLKRGSFIIPSWIKGEAEIPDDLSLLVNNDWSLRRNQKKIRKNQYYYEVTRDPSQYYHFYHDMYLPYVKAAYGDKAIVMSYENLKAKIRNYELLIVKQQGKDIAGAMLSCTAHEASFSLAGVLDGNLDYVQSGALAALYYFFLSHLQARGYKNVKLGSTRAFLKDGVLQYKKKWGLKLIQASETVFVMNIYSLTDEVRDFLLNNPFICLDRIGINGAFFVATNESKSENDLKNILQNYYVKGMSKFLVYRLGENDIKLWKKVALPVSDGHE
jgi:hypothetical protein